MPLTRTEKHSPHASPRLSRRCITPNTVSSTTSQVDISSGQQPQHQQPIQQTPATTSSVTTSLTSSSVSNMNQTTSIISVNVESKPSTASGGSAVNINPINVNLNRSIPNGKIANNRVLIKTNSGDKCDNEDTAPPLPPRKSSSNVENIVNRMLKPQNVSSSSSVIPIKSDNQVATSKESSSNNEFDVPKQIAPPIPKHQQILKKPTSSLTETVGNEISEVLIISEEDNEKVIVGPAETISGIIDTRPLEARKPIISFSNTEGLITDKDSQTTTQSMSNTSMNNLYHLKNNYQHNHMRHQSVPNNNSITKSTMTPTKSVTSQNLNREINRSRISVTNGSSQDQVLFYENVTLNDKDCNVPYENINLEYISRLMKEGYSKENVIAALGISRNNIEMACDILHEFAAKNGT